MHVQKDRSSSPEVVKHIVRRPLKSGSTLVSATSSNAAPSLFQDAEYRKMRQTKNTQSKSRPRPTYAQVVASPPRKTVSPTASQYAASNSPQSGNSDVQHSGSESQSMVVSDQSDADSSGGPVNQLSTPPKASVFHARGTRIPKADAAEGMTTRASNGIVKKRILEDAATISDQENALRTPTKKRKDARSYGSTMQKNSRMDRQSASKAEAGSAKSKKVVIPDPPSDFPSSDETPPSRIFPEPRNNKASRKLPVDSDHNDDFSSPLPKKKSLQVASDDNLFSISPLKLDSAKKSSKTSGRAASNLLPAADIVTKTSLPADFLEWQRNQSEYYAWLKEKNKNKHTKTATFNTPDTTVNLLDRVSRCLMKDAVLRLLTGLFHEPPSLQPAASHSTGASSKGKKRALGVDFDQDQAGEGGTCDQFMEGVLPEEDLQLKTALEESLKLARSGTKASSASSSQAVCLPGPLAKSAAVPNSFTAALVRRGVDLTKLSGKSLVDMKGSTQAQYYADLHGHRVRELPEVCQVTSQKLHDIVLAEDYADLPKLLAGSFRSWSQAVGFGFVLFALWAVQTPDLDLELALEAIRFVQHKHFVNLSRISPLVLNTVHTVADGSRSILHADQRVAICLSSILVIECHLQTPTDRGLRNKFIKGTLHQQEMQRFVGATCMLFNQPVLHAQIERDSMIFSTMGSQYAKQASSTPGQNYLRAPGLLGKLASDVKPLKGFTKATKVVLDVSDTVPIYGARERTFHFNEDLENIDKLLPLFEGEVPAGSFAVVAYTLSVYKKPDSWNLSSNVQFVVVLATYP